MNVYQGDYRLDLITIESFDILGQTTSLFILLHGPTHERSIVSGCVLAKAFQRYENSNSNSISKALAAHAFAWHESNAYGADKDPTSCQIERAVGALF